jgi:hypothetical protein
VEPVGWHAQVLSTADALLQVARRSLGGRLIAMYVHGSFAMGDFDPVRSDVDVCLVTADAVGADEPLLSELRALHERLRVQQPMWGPRLEALYVSADELRRDEPTSRSFPAVHADEGFAVQPLGADFVFQRHVLREFGHVLWGPPPRTLIAPVPPSALRRATLATLSEWWSPMLSRPGRLHDRAQQVHAVLTMCRALYTLDRAAVASKPAAARWAQQRLGEPWSGVIERALAWPHGGAADDLDATLRFIAHVLGLSRAGAAR